MQSFNHVAGGFAFTGILASFADVNIFADADVMAVVWVAAVLPDIDHTKSISGKVVYPLAHWLQIKYGHRTVTHSIFFYIAVVVIVQAADNLFHLHYTLPVALALGSHLIFDMCTRQGIPLFYPFSRRPAVLPANPKLRLSASDYRSEAIVFLLFCCLNVFSYPLMAAGFWNKYNRAFATFDHLESEVRRKPGDYELRLLTPEQDTVTATLVEQKPAELVVYRQSQFRKFDTQQSRLIDFRRLPTHHQFVTINLINVSCDSLNTYMKLPVVKVTAQADSNELFYFEGPIMKKGLNLTIDYPNEARFQQLAIDNRQTEFQLKMLIAQYNVEKAQYNQKLSELKMLRVALHNETTRTGVNDYDEGVRRERIKEYTKQISEFVNPLPPSTEIYHVQRAMLEMKLRENAHLNATILIWQAQANQN
ncbi:metal-dependent hydrolase (plasmid) [Spirosoma taeanense]|uniref:Metal-dependent hydrolase n=1 Tax=Spirosoma taeanense TaxID=2735870 RepID=A0A6M5YHR0_9BACT|nr:metal-dependent hydrolase [Spirosoma taeanense]QJW92492.1 metal-dependent hydrolase [Spirosoma taeanense]